MKQIMKIIGKMTLPIIIIVVLLFVQANFELALPDYTSNIINIGIQQEGIENGTMDVLSSSSMENLKLFLTSDEENYVLNNYHLATKDDKSIKKYPKLETEDIYLLNEDVDEKKIASIMNDAIVTVYTLSDDATVSQMLNASNMTIPDNMSIFDVLAMSDLSMRLNIRTTIMSKIDDSFVNSIVIKYKSTEYEYLGLNLGNIQTNYTVTMGLKMLGIVLAGALISIIVSYLSSKIAAIFSRDLRAKIVNKIMSFSTKEFKEISPASMITRSTNDIQQVQMFLTMLFRFVIYAPILGIGAYMRISNNEMGWVIGVAVIIIVIIMGCLFTLVLPKIQLLQKLIDKLNLVSRQIMVGMTTIRAFSNEQHEEKNFDRANRDLLKVNLFVNKVMALLMPIMGFIMNGICVLIIWVGAQKVDLGVVQVGDLMAFMTYAIQIIIAFLMVSMMSIMIPRAVISLKRLAEILNKKNSVVEEEKTKEIPNNAQGLLEFKDVYFRYPDADEDVLRNVSFKASQGTTTAIIGSTGCGKSTLVNLIPRFFDVTAGSITIDGIDIRKCSLHDLRHKIGFVPQKGNLFSGTIKENIKFGNNSLSDEEVFKYAKIAQADNFIKEKDKGYDEMISQGSKNVSGGQRQRLAIARALAVKPEIYVFDDSFSALDFRTENKLKKALKKEVKDATIIVVAQRISSVINADNIVVLDEGEVVGIGNHQELMKTCQVYQEIALSQATKEELTHE